MQTQRITHVIESQTVTRLRKQQRDYMLTSQLGNQVHRNQIASLTQEGEFTAVGLVVFLFFIPAVWQG